MTTTTIPGQPPSAPGEVSAVAGDAEATVSWTAPSDGDSPIPSYTSTPCVAGTAQAPQTFHSLATSQTLTGLSNGTASSFTVTAANAVGSSPPSAAACPVTPTAPTLKIINGAGGKAGRPEQGDQSVITFSPVPSLSALCSAWSQTSHPSLDDPNVVVTGIRPGSGDDTVTVTDFADCSGGLHFGTIDLGQRGYFNTGTAPSAAIRSPACSGSHDWMRLDPVERPEHSHDHARRGERRHPTQAAESMAAYTPDAALGLAGTIDSSKEENFRPRARPRSAARQTLSGNLYAMADDHKEHWKTDPDDHDYPAAASYLALLSPPAVVDALVAALRAAPLGHWKAKDLLRASGLPLLPADNAHVASDLKKVAKGDKLSPVLDRPRGLEDGGPHVHRRRLPPRLRELPPRRGRRHPLPHGRADKHLTRTEQLAVGTRRPTVGSTRADMTSLTRPNRIYPGYVLDLDGTVYLGDSLLPHVAETIEELRRRGSRVVYVTNKPLETAEDYARKLTRLGLATTRSDVVTSVDALDRLSEARASRRHAAPRRRAVGHRRALRGGLQFDDGTLKGPGGRRSLSTGPSTTRS